MSFVRDFITRGWHWHYSQFKLLFTDSRKTCLSLGFSLNRITQDATLLLRRSSAKKQSTGFFHLYDFLLERALNFVFTHMEQSVFFKKMALLFSFCVKFRFYTYGTKGFLGKWHFFFYQKSACIWGNNDISDKLSLPYLHGIERNMAISVNRKFDSSSRCISARFFDWWNSNDTNKSP